MVIISWTIGLPQGWTSSAPNSVRDTLDIYPWASTISEARLDHQHDTHLNPARYRHHIATAPSPSSPDVWVWNWDGCRLGLSGALGFHMPSNVELKFKTLTLFSEVRPPSCLRAGPSCLNSLVWLLLAALRWRKILTAERSSRTVPTRDGFHKRRCLKTFVASR